MSNMIHGWWLERKWGEIHHDFTPFLDADGNAVLTASESGAGDLVEYGTIKTTRWTFVELSSVTSSCVPTSVGSFISSNILNVPVAGRTDPEPLVIDAGIRWMIGPYESTLASAILGLWSHKVIIKSGEVDLTYGPYTDVNLPSVEEE